MVFWHARSYRLPRSRTDQYTGADLAMQPGELRIFHVQTDVRCQRNALQTPEQVYLELRHGPRAGRTRIDPLLGQLYVHFCGVRTYVLYLHVPIMICAQHLTHRNGSSVPFTPRKPNKSLGPGLLPVSIRSPTCLPPTP